VRKQLATFKRGKLNIIGVEGPINKRVIKEVEGGIGEVLPV
jgi:hypothetical protein